MCSLPLESVMSTVIIHHLQSTVDEKYKHLRIHIPYPLDPHQKVKRSSSLKKKTSLYSPSSEISPKPWPNPAFIPDRKEEAGMEFLGL